MLGTILTSEAFRYLALPVLVAAGCVFVKRRVLLTVRAGSPAARISGRVKPQLEDSSIWIELFIANLAQLLLVAVDRQVALEDRGLPRGLHSTYVNFVTWAPWVAVASAFLLWAFADQVGKYRRVRNLRTRFLRAYVYPHAAAAATLVFSFVLVSR